MVELFLRHVVDPCRRAWTKFNSSNFLPHITHFIHQIGIYRLLSFLRTGLSIDMACCAKWNTHRTPPCTPCVRVVNGIKNHWMRKSTRGTSTTISLSVTSQKAIPFTFRFSLSSIPRSGMWCQTASLLPLPPLHVHYLITRMVASEIIDR